MERGSSPAGSRPAQGARKPGLRRWLIVVVIALVTAAAFGGVSRNGFISYDDGEYLTANPVVRQGLTARGIAWAFTTTRPENWHPLTWLSHLLDVELFGMDPGAHHLVSLALHAANAALLFLVLVELTGARWRSALVAALFAVHPLHVESVAWAAERKDVLSTLFALAALLAYVRAARRGRVAGSVGPPAFLLLALLAKPMPVTLPLLLLLLDWWPLGRWSQRPAPARLALLRFLPPGRLWLEKAPLFLLAAASAAITLVVQKSAGAMAFGSSLSLARRGANAVLAYAFYLRKAVVPVDLALYYPYPVEAPPWWLWSGWLAALAGVTALAARGARRRPHLLVGWLWFLGVLVPAIGIVQVGSQAWADRYTYLPLVGLFLAAAWALAGLAAARPALAMPCAAAACAAIVVCGGLTRAQVGRWRDSVTLYRHAIAVTGDNPVVWNLIGNAFSGEGRLEQAVEAYRTARKLAGGRSSTTHVDFNLAAALHAQGRTREAAEAYRDVLVRNPADGDALNNLGNIALAEGRPGEAVTLYRRALAADPRLAAAHYNLGRALAEQGDAAGAGRHLREALALDPQDEGAAALLRALGPGEGTGGPPEEPRR